MIQRSGRLVGHVLASVVNVFNPTMIVIGGGVSQAGDQLLATIRQQRDANRAMHEQVASLEGRLDQSEKELARLGKPGTRLSSRKHLSRFGRQNSRS